LIDSPVPQLSELSNLTELRLTRAYKGIYWTTAKLPWQDVPKAEEGSLVGFAAGQSNMHT
jgi:hypothetical protein